MRKKSLLALLTILSMAAVACTSGVTKKITKNESVVGRLGDLPNRELAKDYFVCSCIYYSQEKKGVKYEDGSSSSYIDFLGTYSFGSLQKIDQYAKVFVDDKINFGVYEGRNFMIKKCLSHRSSKELDLFIESLENEDAKDK